MIDDACALCGGGPILTGNPVRPASDRRGGWPGWVGSLRLVLVEKRFEPGLRRSRHHCAAEGW